jgi:hypothetical protein
MAANVTCANCGVEFWMTDGLERARRRDGSSFYCPNGHSLSYAPTEDQKQIKELEGQLESQRRQHRRLINDYNELWAQREELVADLKVCPLGCGYRSRRQVPRDPVAMGRGLERVRTDMVDHLRVVHGARIPATKLLKAGA